MKYLANKKGFTLIETLVAIGIFAFSITGLISVTSSGVFNTNFVKNKFTAGYLALEGAELVRNIRDTAAIQSNSWSGILFSPNLLQHCVRGADLESCMIDTWAANVVPVSCPTDGCPAMSFNDTTGRFSYSPTDNNTIFQSIFTRTIFIEQLSGNEARVTSTVSWRQGPSPHEVTYTYNLKNWNAQP
jgi:prepilin-type N-terminal cleavage/methylation domain-containing protein